MIYGFIRLVVKRSVAAHAARECVVAPQVTELIGSARIGVAAEPPLVAYRGWAPGLLTVWMLGFLAVTTALTAVHRTFWIAARLKPAAKPSGSSAASPTRPDPAPVG